MSGRGRRLAIAIGVAAIAMSSGGVAPAAGELVERRFDAALELERAGQLAEAIEMYRRIVDEHPESELADDALLALARIAWPVDDPHVARSRPADAGALRDARAPLETLRDRYPGSDSAPEGLWRLGLSHLVPDPLFYDPQRAAALLTTLPRLHPASSRVPASRALAATLHLREGREEVARGLAFAVLTDSPQDPAAREAWLVLGRVAFAAGEAEKALHAFGRAAESARSHGASASAREATGLATILDRVAYGAQRDAPRWAADRPRRGVAVGDRAGKIATTSDGRLWVHVPRGEALLAYDEAGGSLGRREAEGALTFGLDRWDRVWTVTEDRIVAPHGPIPLPEGVEARALVPTGPSSAWIVDDDERAAVRVDAGAGVVARVELPEREVPELIAPAARGGVWIVTTRPVTLREVDDEGRVRVELSLETIVSDPVDLAVDPLGHVYVLDAKPPAIVALSGQGDVIERVEIDPETSGIVKPTALTVDDAGGVGIFDSKSRRVSWLD